MTDKFDWNKLKIEYVTTKITYLELSEKYNVPMRTIRDVGGKEHWVAERRKYKQRIYKKALTKQSEKDAQGLSKVITAVENAVMLLADSLANKDQFYTYITEKTEQYSDGVTSTDESGQNVNVVMRKHSEERRFSKLDTRSLREATTALKELTIMLRDFYDIPTAAQQEQRMLALERLELEKQKLKAVMPDDDEEQTGVILIPERRTNNEQ